MRGRDRDEILGKGRIGIGPKSFKPKNDINTQRSLIINLSTFLGNRAHAHMHIHTQTRNNINVIIAIIILL